jgi:hypothetical protein
MENRVGRAISHGTGFVARLLEPAGYELLEAHLIT